MFLFPLNTLQLNSRFHAVGGSEDPLRADDGASTLVLVVGVQTDLPGPSPAHRFVASYNTAPSGRETHTTVWKPDNNTQRNITESNPIF